MGDSNEREKGENFVINFFSVLLVLFTPFLVFVDSNNYLFEYSSLYFLLFFAVIASIVSTLFRLVPSDLLRILILTILLLLFIDFQFDWIQAWGTKLAATGVTLFLILWVLRTHAGKLLVVVFGTATAVSLGSPLLSNAVQAIVISGSGPERHNTDLPLYVHIILDGQIGIEGLEHEIPSHNKLQNDLGNFFAEQNFRLFGRAYSPYFDTRDSVSSTLNHRVSDTIGETYTGELHRHSLLENAYFEKILAMNYAINVYQSTFMDFCKSLEKRIQKCLTYNYYGFSGADLKGLADYEKLRFVALTYEKLSILVQSIRIFYRVLNLHLQGREVKTSDLISWTGTFGPIPTLPIFDKLIKDVSTAPGGTMIFAHLLIPHSPYSVDSACSVRHPILIWNKRIIEHEGPELFNTPDSRRAHYEEFISQDRCVLLKLQELMAAIKRRKDYEDAIIIVHGDHGSRITLVEPRLENKDRLSRQDYFDAFSTLYAVKAPGIAPGYDPRMVAIADLLRATMPGNQNSSMNFPPNMKPTVFFRHYTESQNKSGLHELAMPELPTSYR